MLKIGDFFVLTWSIFAGPVTICADGMVLAYILYDMVWRVYLYYLAVVF